MSLGMSIHKSSKKNWVSDLGLGSNPNFYGFMGMSFWFQTQNLKPNFFQLSCILIPKLKS